MHPNGILPGVPFQRNLHPIPMASPPVIGCALLDSVSRWAENRAAARVDQERMSYKRSSATNPSQPYTPRCSFLEGGHSRVCSNFVY